jgi:hypothetical protein
MFEVRSDMPDDGPYGLKRAILLIQAIKSHYIQEQHIYSSTCPIFLTLSLVMEKESLQQSLH